MIVQITVIAPTEGNQQFTGTVVVANDDNANDVGQVPVILVTPVQLQSARDGLAESVLSLSRNQCAQGSIEHLIPSHSLIGFGPKNLF